MKKKLDIPMIILLILMFSLSATFLWTVKAHNLFRDREFEYYLKQFSLCGSAGGGIWIYPEVNDRGEIVEISITNGL